MVETSHIQRINKTRMERFHKNKKKENKGILLLVTAAFAVFCAYAGGTFYFQNHFYRNTTVNNVDVSYLDVNEACKIIENKTLVYDIQIQGRDNINDTINSRNLELQVNDMAENEIQKLKNSQSSLLWVSCLFKANNYFNSNILCMNEDKFNENFNELNIVNNKNIIEPQEPFYKYDGKEFQLVPEVKGNKIIQENMKKNIKNGILNGEKIIDVKAGDSYENPKFSQNLQQVIDAKEKVNEFKDIKLTYVFDDGNKVIDGYTIEKWFSYNENFQLSIDQNKIKEFIDNFAYGYGCSGQGIKFKTSHGKDIIVSGGDYGNIIDKDAEQAAILRMLNSKESEQRTPIYTNKEEKTGMNGIGNTYVEVDLTNQHLWFYKNSQLVCDGDIVSGNVLQGRGTPPGVYTLKGKEINATLVGQDYRTPVNYWMPFNGGIGIHDAYWRGAFGGEIYYGGGSHGCVNAPYALAQSIFNNIEVNTPIVCHY